MHSHAFKFSFAASVLLALLSGGCKQAAQDEAPAHSAKTTTTTTGGSTGDQGTSTGSSTPDMTTSNGSTSTTGSMTGSTTDCNGTTASVSYQNDIQAMLASHCVNCHSPSGGRNPDLSNYLSAKANAQASLNSVQLGKMPQSGPLSADDQAKFAAWVAAGEPEVSTSSGSLATTGSTAVATYSYDNDIKSIIDAKCGQCHGAGNKPPDLSNYVNVSSASMNVINEIEQNQMPPSGSPVLASDERSKIRAWIDGGKLQSGGNSGCGQSVTGSATGMGTTTTNDADKQEAWSDMLNPSEFTECRSKGFVFDRSKLAEQCLKSKIATSYQCTRQGIIDKFKAVGVNITSNMALMESSGYVIDQCGEFNNEPIVFFYLKQDGDSQLTLKVKKFCKSNSQACN